MKTPLNFGWRFASDFQDAYLNSLPDNALTVDLPHAAVTVPYNYFSEKDFQGTFTYENTFDIPDLAGKLAFLVFEGAMLTVRLVINGVDLGTKISGWVPISFDITKQAKVTGNRVVVIVDSHEDPTIPPFGNAVDYLTFAGIYRPVYLETKPQTYIDTLFAFGDSHGRLFVKSTLKGNDKGSLSYRVLLDGKSIKEFVEEDTLIDYPELWSLSTPCLYTLEATFHGPVDDTKTIAFGFRDAEFKMNGFYLNGKKVKLLGLNRHQNYPYVGPALPASAQRDDADILKIKIGCNVVRTSHYPQSEDFLNRCDELGLMVIDEIPGWQYVGTEEAWRKNFEYFLTGMVEKERNHPCLIAYGTHIDESGDDDDLYEKAVKLVHKMDPFRQCLGVRNFKTSHCLEDVYAYNDFSCASLEHGLDDPKTVKGAKDKPLLITEHNGHMFPTKQFDNPSRRLEQALRHLRVLDDAFKYDRVSGVIGWCAFDYNTHKDFGSGDHICYHGVYDIFRHPKAAAFAYASQTSPVPVMWVANPPTTGDYDEALIKPLYIFTNCDYVEFYRGGNFVDVFKPDKKDFPNLPHPPVKIDDFIGAMFKDEGFSKKDGEKIKEALNYVGQNGLAHLKKTFFLKYLPVILRNHLNQDKLVALYGKYVQKADLFTLKGYKGGYLKVEKSFGPSTTFSYRYEKTSEELLNGDTYDVARISVKYVDEWGSQLHYAFKPLQLEVAGPIQILGPSEVSLVGGDISIWVRSLSVKAPSPAELIIHTDQGDETINFMVQ
jgi:beta-galactosidase